MAFALLICITNGSINRLRVIRKAMLIEDLLNDGRRGVAKTLVPQGRRQLDGGKHPLIWGRLQGVEASFTSASKQNLPRCSILNEKIIRVKLKECIIIGSKFMNTG